MSDRSVYPLTVQKALDSLWRQSPANQSQGVLVRDDEQVFIVRIVGGNPEVEEREPILVTDYTSYQKFRNPRGGTPASGIGE